MRCGILCATRAAVDVTTTVVGGGGCAQQGCEEVINASGTICMC